MDPVPVRFRLASEEMSESARSYDGFSQAAQEVAAGARFRIATLEDWSNEERSANSSAGITCSRRPPHRPRYRQANRHVPA
ncbi:MAG TPA: hypothetical protein VGQ93_10635 [Lysobacter sp.]|jgi:hypothetical protein|nr:hypothetical protein [Lysobacter sp.]